MYKSGHDSPAPSGTTTSYQLYKLSEWLWSKEIRKNFHEIVSYVLTHELDPLKTEQDRQNTEFIKKIIGADADDGEISRFNNRLMTLARIKMRYPEFLEQLKKNGNLIYNYKSVECLLLTHFHRIWFYGQRSTASSCVLLAPKISRVFSFESSETNIGNLSQLDGLTLTNVQIYAAFNRIKGLKNRSWSKMQNPDILNQIKFLCRTIRDIAIIHNSRLMRYMSFIPTSGDESKKFQVGQYFAVLGKISGLRYRSQIGPSDVKTSVIQDFSGNLVFQIRDRQIIESANSPMNKDVKKWFGVESIKIENEISLNYDGYVFAIGFWSIEENYPWIIQIIPLGQHIEPVLLSTYDVSAYLNTRKKVSSKIIPLVFPNSNTSLSNSLLEMDGVTYYVESGWDKETFKEQLRLIVSGRFIIPDLGHEDRNLKSIIPTNNRVNKSDQAEVELFYDYFRINGDYLALYSAPVGSGEFSRTHHISKNDTCHQCGSELYEITPYSVEELAKKHEAEILVDFSVDSNHLQMLGETISFIVHEIEHIISVKDERKAAEFVARVTSSAKWNDPTFDVGNITKLEFLRDVLTSMSSLLLNGKKITFEDLKHGLESGKKYNIQFSINSNISGNPNVLRTLAFFNASSVLIKSATMNERIFLGKICPMGHNIVDNGINRTNIMTFIESYRISLLDKEKKLMLLESFTNLKKIAHEWVGLTSSAILRKLELDMLEKRKTSENLEKIVNSLEKFCPLKFQENLVDSKDLEKLKINNISFFLVCKQINDGKFASPDDLGKILLFVSKFESLMDDSDAARSGVINNADSLLRVIALRYAKFHYERIMGNSSQIIREKDFYDYDLIPLLHRCLELTGRQKNLYRNLARIDPSSRIFGLICDKLLFGEIRNVNSANAFLKTIPEYLYKKPEHILVKHKRLEKVSHRRIFPDKKIIIKDSNTHSPPVRISEFGDLYYTWKRMQTAKSKTHQPLQYQEIKREFQIDFNRVVSSLKDIAPSFRKLIGLTVDSKIVNTIFREIGMQGKFSPDGIIEVVKKNMSQD